MLLGASLLALLACPSSAGEAWCLWTTNFGGRDQCVTTSTRDGDLFLDRCSGLDEQRWQFRDHQAVSAVGVNGARSCVTVLNYREADWKSEVILWPCDSEDPNQQWNKNDMFRSAIQWQGARKCIDVEGAQNLIIRECGDTTPMWEWDCHSAASCRYGPWSDWSACGDRSNVRERHRHRDVLRGSDPDECRDTTDIGDCDGYSDYHDESCLINPATDASGRKCLTMDTTANGLVLVPCTGEDRQRWIYEDGFLRCLAPFFGSTVCVTIQDIDLVPQLWPCSAEIPRQRWASRYDALICPVLGMCLTAGNRLDWTRSLEPVVLRPCVGGPDQRWSFRCGNAPYLPGSFYTSSRTLVPPSPVSVDPSILALLVAYPAPAGTLGTAAALPPPLIPLSGTVVAGASTTVTAGTTGTVATTTTTTTTSSSSSSSSTISFQKCSIRPVANTAECLTAVAGTTPQKVVVQPCTSPASTSQTWSYDGQHTLTNQGLCFDISGGIHGKDLILWSCSNGQNQRFAFAGGRITNDASGRLVVWVAGSPNLWLVDDDPDSSYNWSINC